MRKRKNVKPSIRKRSFLLFELLISLALLMLCLFPLIKPHLGIHKVQVVNLEKMQGEQKAYNMFCRLKERLYENRHSWKELMEGTEGTIEKEGEVCRYVITQLDYAYKQNSPNSALVLDIALYFPNQENPYSHTLYVERKER